jgi:hypothetical protein
VFINNSAAEEVPDKNYGRLTGKAEVILKLALMGQCPGLRPGGQPGSGCLYAASEAARSLVWNEAGPPLFANPPRLYRA